MQPYSNMLHLILLFLKSNFLLKMIRNLEAYTVDLYISSFIGRCSFEKVETVTQTYNTRKTCA